MSASVEAADLLGRIAGGSGTNKERQLRAWRKLVSEFPSARWTFNRVHDLFTQDSRAVVSGDEIKQLRRVAKAHEEITILRTEYDDLIARIERCERALVLSDEEFHGPALDGYRAALHGARRAGRAVDALEE